MSTEAVRNLISNKITGVIFKAKQQIKEEGKKQVTKLKERIPSPQDLKNQSNTTPSLASCTGKGKEQFDKKHKDQTEKLDKIQKAISKSLSKLKSIQDKLNAIQNGVLKKISALAETLDPIVSTLSIIVTIANIMVKTIAMIPSTVASPNPAGPTLVARDGGKLAAGKVVEFAMLILSIPPLVLIYTDKINKIKSMVDIAVSKLQALKDKIDQLVIFQQYLKLEFESQCDDLLNPSNNNAIGTGLGEGGKGKGLINGNNISSINNGMTLEDLIAHTESLYGNMLNQLKAQGNTKALERISILQKEMKEWKLKYNISFKIIKI